MTQRVHSPRLSTLPDCERDGSRLTRHPFHDDYARLSDRLHPRPSGLSLKHDSAQVDTPLALPPPPPPSTPDAEAQHSRARLLQHERQRRYRARQDTYPSTHTGACHSLPNLSLLPPSHTTPFQASTGPSILCQHPLFFLPAATPFFYLRVQAQARNGFSSAPRAPTISLTQMRAPWTYQP